MNKDQMLVISQMVQGLELAIVHAFNCLHHKDVLPRSEAISSLRATAEALPESLSQSQVPMILRHIVAGLESIKDPDPSGPNSTRPFLTVIEGGLSDKS